MGLMLIKFMFLSAFTFIDSYHFENHLCNVMRRHYNTQRHPVALYQCYEMLAFLLATLIIYQQVSRADKSSQMWKEVSLVPRPSHCPVCDHLQAIKNWTVGRPGNEASKKSLA